MQILYISIYIYTVNILIYIRIIYIYYMILCVQFIRLWRRFTGVSPCHLGYHWHFWKQPPAVSLTPTVSRSPTRTALAEVSVIAAWLSVGSTSIHRKTRGVNHHLMVNCWFGLGPGGLDSDWIPKMKGRKGFESGYPDSNPKPPGPKPTIDH